MSSDDLSAARRVLHVVATHVLARRRYEASGRFGLRPSPGGIATPAYGSEPEVLRISGTVLVREVGGDAAYAPMEGASLGELAAFAGTRVDEPFDAGADTPEPGDPGRPLRLEAEAVGELAAWWSLGASVLDGLVGALPAATPATIQIWPEHFDVATNVALPGAGRVNLGFSPGDSWRPEPYAYLGPWDAVRPGDPAYWNAPFGAVLGRSELSGGGWVEQCRSFFQTGFSYLTGDQP